MADLTTIFHHLQRQLFPVLEAELGALSALDRQFCEVISLTSLGRFTQTYEWCGNGCPPCPRVWLAHAFIAKSVYQFPTTSALLDALRSRPLLRQLCGWDSPGEIPSEPTFSRAFKQFADEQKAGGIERERVELLQRAAVAGNQVMTHPNLDRLNGAVVQVRIKHQNLLHQMIEGTDDSQPVIAHERRGCGG
jgi:hypothetical protein